MMFNNTSAVSLASKLRDGVVTIFYTRSHYCFLDFRQLL